MNHRKFSSGLALVIAGTWGWKPWSTAFRPDTWSNWALVFVGIVASVIGVITLRAILRQTNAIENQLQEMRNSGKQTDKLIDEATKQSMAATKSADALIASERAWIDGELKRVLPEKDPGWDDMSTADYQLGITNYGRTPAYIIGWEIGVDCLAQEIRELRPETLSHRTSKELHIFLPPGESELLGNFDMARYIPDWMDVLAGKKIGVFQATIKYFDIISGTGKSREPRETSFVYSYSTVEALLKRLNWLNLYK